MMSTMKRMRSTLSGAFPVHRAALRCAGLALVLAWGMAGVAAATAVPQVTCASLKTPANTAQQLIAPRIIINGRLMSIVAANSRLSPGAFAQFYKDLWKGQPNRPLFVEDTLGPWDVVGHKEGQCYYTVQIRADGKGGSTALLGIGTLGQDFGSGVLDFPAPGDARPLTHMVSQDGGRNGDTWLLYTANLPGAVVDWYTQNMPSFGWSQDMPSARGSGPSMLMFSKGRSHAGIVVAPLKSGASITLTVMSQ